MADEQVGTVSVKVLPDTKGFRRKLKAELDAIEKGLELTIEVGLELSKADLARAKKQLQDLGNDAKVKIKAELDSSGVTRGLRSALDRAQAELDANPVDFKLDSPDLDWGGLREEIQRTVDRATQGIEAKIPADIWDDGLRAKMNRIVKELNSLTDGVDIDVDIATEEARAEFNRLKGELDDEVARLRVELEDLGAKRKLEAILQQIRDQKVNISVGLDGYEEGASKMEELSRDRDATVNVRVDALRAAAEIAVLARDRTLTFHAEFSDSSVGRMARTLASFSGARAVKKMATDLTDMIDGMDEAMPRFVALTSTAGAAAGVLLSAAGAALALGKGVVDVGRAGLLLPAVYSAAAISMGVFNLAMTDANKYIPDVINQFKNLQPVISGGFWEKAAGPVREFSNAFQPLAYRVLPALANAYGDVAGAVAKSATAFVRSGAMEGYFKNLTKGIQNSVKGFGSLTTGILKLAGAGSKYFPAMGKAFSSAMGDFSKWTDKITSDGTFDRWMRTAGESAKSFGSIVKSTGSILGSFYKASIAAGGPTMQDVAKGFDSVARAVGSVKGMKTITTMFEGAYQSARNLAPGLRNLGNAFVDFAPYVSRSMATAGSVMSAFFTNMSRLIRNPEFGQGMVHMFDGFKSGMERLRPVFDTLGSDLGRLMGLFGLVADDLAKVLAVSSKELGVLFQDLIEAISALIPVLSDWLIGAIEAIAPAVRGAAGALKDFTVEHPKLAAAALIAGTGILGLIKIIGMVARPFATAYAAFSRLSGILGKLPTPALGASGALGGVGRALMTAGRFAGRFGGWIGVATLALKGMWDSSDTLRGSVKNLGGSLLDLGKGVADTVAPYFKDFAENTLPGLKKAFGDLSDGVSPIMKFLGDTLGTKINKVAEDIRLATPAIKKFSGALANGANQGLKTFSHGISGLGKAIQGDWKGAWEELKQGSAEAAKIFPEPIQQAMDKARERLVKFVEEDVPSFIDGVRDFASRAGEAFQNLPETIGQVFDTVKSFIVTKVTEWFLGMGQAISTGVATVVTFFQTLPETIGQVFDTVKSFIVTKVTEWFLGMGQAILTGIATVVTFFQNLILTITTIYDQVKLMIITKVMEWFLGMGTAIMTGIATVVTFFQNLILTITMIYDQIKLMIITKVMEWFLGMGTAIMTGIAMVVTFFQNLILTITMIYDQIKLLIITKVMEWFLGMGTAILTGIATVVTFFQNLILTITTIYDQIKLLIITKVAEWFLGMGTAILTGIAVVVSFFRNLYNGIMVVMTTIASQLVSKAVQWFVGMGSAVSSGISRVVSFFQTLPGRAMSAIASLAGQLISTAQRWMQGMGSAVSSGISRVVSFFQTLPGRAMSAIASLAGQLVSTAQQWMQGMGSAVQAGISQVVSFFQSLPGQVVGALAGMAGQLRSVGTQMMEGLIGGITAMAGRVAESARSVVAGAVNAAKAALGIHSPSRVFRAIGEYTGMGYIKGMDSMASSVLKATDRMVSLPSSVEPPAAPALGAGGMSIQVVVPEREGEDPTRLGNRISESIAFQIAKGVNL